MVAPHLQELVSRLVDADREERGARRAARQASTLKVHLLQQLREEGLSYADIALHLGKGRGHAPTLEERKWFGQQLRQMASRVTRRHSSLGATGSHETAAPLSLAHYSKEQNAMPKLIKRVTTEEFIADEDEALDGLDETGDDEQDEGEEEEEEERPRRRK